MLGAEGSEEGCEEPAIYQEPRGKEEAAGADQAEGEERPPPGQFALVLISNGMGQLASPH